MVRAVFHAFLALAFSRSGTFSGPRSLTWASMFVCFSAVTLTGPLVVRVVQRFPHGHPPTSLLTRILPLTFVAIGSLWQTCAWVWFPLSARSSPQT